MLLRLWILARIIAAAHAGASAPRRFLSDDPGETTCVDGVVDKTGLPCTVCDGESAEDYCNCHTDCELKPPDEDAKFCACAEAQACCECRDSDAWKKTGSDLGCAWVAEFPGVPGDWKRCRAKGVIDCVEIKILRRVRAESHRRPPRHRRDACSMAWASQFLTARRSKRGHAIAEK